MGFMRQLYWMSALSVLLACTGFWMPSESLAQGTATKAAAAVAEEEDDYLAAEYLLPKGTTVYFAFPDVPGLVEGVKGSVFGQLLADPDFQPFLSQIKGLIEKGGEEIKEELGLTIKDLLSIPQGQVAVAVIPVDGGELAGVLIADYGDSEDTINQLIDKMEAALKENGSEINTEKVDDVELTIVTLPEEKVAESPVKELAYFLSEGTIVFGTSKGAVLAVLERWEGESEDVLANNETFAAILEKVGRADDSLEADFKWYLDPITLTNEVALALQESQPNVQSAVAMFPLLGLDKLKGLGGALIIDEGDFDALTKTYIKVDQPTTGVLNLFQFPAIAMTPPKWVGSNAAMYTALNWDFQAAYKATEGLYDSFLGQGNFARQIEAIADQPPNIHIKTDIIDLLGGKLHITSTAGTISEDKPAGDLTVAIEVKDSAAASKLIDKVLGLGIIPSETITFEGQKIFKFETGNEELTPALAVVNNAIMVTFDIKAIEGIVRGTRTPLATSPTYAKLSKHFPAKVSGITFQKGDAQIKTLYEQLRNGEGLAEQVEDIDFKKLPPFEKLAKYLRSSAGYTTNDETGSLTVQFSLKEADPK